MKKNCPTCNKEFETPPSAPHKKFCSIGCKQLVKDLPMTCDSCGKSYLAWHNVKYIKRDNHYCSPSCFAKAPRIGRSRRNAEKRGGNTLTMSDGYKCFYLPEHPNSNIKGLYAEHRLVMEKHIGRLLTKKEVVHHIDGDVSNNSIDNLMLFTTSSEHLSYHKEQRQLAKQNAVNVSP
jgi:hypothetical protein